MKLSPCLLLLLILPILQTQCRADVINLTEDTFSDKVSIIFRFSILIYFQQSRSIVRIFFFCLNFDFIMV